MPSRLLLMMLLHVVAGSVLADELSSERREQLRNLVHQDCGSCHGMQLRGGLGPALTPEALQDKHHEFLVITIREGRPGTPMPPWKTLLGEADIEWIVDYLKTPGVAP